MVAAISATPNPKFSSRAVPNQSSNQTAASTRPPLLPSEGGDNVVAPSRRPKSREVTSRYMATPTPISRRCPSPSVSRTATVGTPAPMMQKRSQSAERRRPATPRPSTSNGGGGEGATSNAAAKMLSRSLSVSFQGESFSLRVAKPAASLRQGTPERRKAATPLRGGIDRRDDSNSNAKAAMDQHRWPARLRQGNSLSRSMDCTDERRKKLDGSGNVVVRALQLQSSLIDDRSRNYTDLVDANSATGREGSNTISADFSVASDVESVSSGSTSGAQEHGIGVTGRAGQRGVIVPARCWQDTNTRLRQGRSSEASSPQSKSIALKTTAGATPKLTLPKKRMDTPVSSPRGLASPIRGSSIRPASPSKFSTSAVSSPVRGTSPARTREASPARARNGVTGTSGSNLSNAPSMFTFAADVRRGKMGEKRIEEAHELRLLDNRLLQWRYVNARADAANLAQTMTAEKNLYSASKTISKLRDSVRDKRIMMQMLRQNMKLTSILKEQLLYLDEWAIMDRDHSNSLSGTVEAFKASTLRLPIVGGARAEVQNVKDAIWSAVDVMQAMESSIYTLLPKVDGVNLLVLELANVASKERVLLNQVKGILSTIEAMQVKDCSLRTHTLQLHRLIDYNYIDYLEA